MFNMYVYQNTKTKSIEKGTKQMFISITLLNCIYLLHKNDTFSCSYFKLHVLYKKNLFICTYLPAKDFYLAFLHADINNQREKLNT